MSDALDTIGRHVNGLLTRLARPLYLSLDSDFRLLASRGSLKHYGLRGLDQGTAMLDRLPVLSGVDPDGDDTQSWRFISLPDAPVCDVHVVRQDAGWGVALLDVSADHADHQARQQTAHELLLTQHERDRLLNELDQANRLKTEFIARMSHEFRTPLTSVLGYSQQLHGLCDTAPELAHHAAAIERGGRYLLNLVENLLDQAQIEIDALRLNPGACDLHRLGDDIEKLLRPLAEQKSLSLAWWFDSNIPSRLWLDATRLEQVLINLVGNAIKFTRDGAINVEIDWQDGRLDVAVSDTGPGIDPQDIDTLFVPFHQASAGAKGAGLGLAISRAIVRAMGGDIQVGSNNGHGSRFEFSVNAETVRAGGKTSTDALAGKRIMLADDDPDLLDLFSLYLKAAGCTVECVAEASQILTRTSQFRPDLVVLDFNLGDTNGADAAQSLRRQGYRQCIALLSANNPDSDNASETGLFDARWRKPIGRAQLLDNIANLLS